MSPRRRSVVFFAIASVIGCASEPDAGPPSAGRGVHLVEWTVPADEAGATAVRVGRERASFGLASAPRLARRVRERRAGGVEEWLDLPVAPPVEEATWRVASTAVGVRLVDGVLELLDARGAPWIRMARPFILDRHGARHPVDVRVEGCAADRDPRPPWGRRPVDPGARGCLVRLAWHLDPDAYPARLDPYWSETDRMGSPRSLHTATRLADGRVLVAGGVAFNEDLSACEIFDPESGTFAATEPLASARRGGVDVRLAGGDVLVVGGDTGLGGETTAVPTLERWSPSTGEWTTGSPAGIAFTHHAVTRLADDRIVVSGSLDYATGEASDVVVLCDATASECTETAPMPEPRADHAAALLADGRVLVAGGGARVFVDAGSFHASTILFDPETEAWTEGPPMPSARVGSVATRLADGRVLLVGGTLAPQGSDITPSVLAVDPDASSIAEIGSLVVPRWLHRVEALPSGALLVVGRGNVGFTSSDLRIPEIFDPASGTSRPIDALPTPLIFHATTPLEDGRVLITGGKVSDLPEDTDRAHLFGDPLGGPCELGVASSCPNGICVEGICSAAPAPTGAGGGSGAGGGGGHGGGAGQGVGAGGAGEGGFAAGTGSASSTVGDPAVTTGTNAPTAASGTVATSGADAEGGAPAAPRSPESYYACSARPPQGRAGSASTFAALVLLAIARRRAQRHSMG